MVQQFKTSEQIVTSNLASRGQAKLVSKTVDDVGALPKTHVQYL